ncbi:DUF2207 domain-containing protein [Cellulomonas bogoriensis]|uniref:DUF2207 domain-containing protein n=1 Tax=Cellulomonas bogoriensis 69B4 = DSM 16987 TaxID=1386082 RepID=A0A0A0BY29_9CELL|nr:DUF2207 domain-containing protein [Cellulomonas bogoriensis]KGM13273.1 hypothetical protein N869_10895 [Cellulomonas bogoriensis 69B4 = DSM 16987]
MRRLPTALALSALIGALLGLGAASPAAANPDDDHVARYDMVVDLQHDGRADVSLTLVMDFGTEPNRGPYLTFVSRQEVDENYDRLYLFSDVTATSPTAPTPVHVEDEGGITAIRIGDPDRRELTGKHTYQVRFTVDGWVNTGRHLGEDRDELYLNVLSNWDLTVRDVTVTVQAPYPPQDAECWVGRGEATPCEDSAASPDAASFAQSVVHPGEAFTVGAAYPRGTFPTADPILVERQRLSDSFAVTPVTVPLAALLAIGGTWLVVRTIRREGTDEQYIGLTPGLTPPPGHDAPVGPKVKAPVAVRFTPPEGLRAGELGTLIDQRADPHDVTATIIDLAVRGYLRIEDVNEVKNGRREWRLVPLPRDVTTLLPHERTLLMGLFPEAEPTLLSELRTTFHTSMTKVQDELYEEVTRQGWFRGNPKLARASWLSRATGVLVVGLAAAILLPILTSWGLVGLAAAVPGVVMMFVVPMAPARTAKGTAILTQTTGFRRYLETAEADQLRFEEGEDVFSRYLPFAVAFGLTERWSKVFTDLAAQGRPLPEPTWYVGAWGAGFWAGASNLGTELSSFTSTLDTAVAAPSTGGSGGSFSGGGFSGGGVGGGGGGSW